MTRRFQEVEDLMVDGIALQSLPAALAGTTGRPHPLKQWASWDVVADLHLSKLWAVAALQDPQPSGGRLRHC